MKPTLLSTVGLVLVLSQGAVAQTPDCCSPLAKAQPRPEMVCTLVICASAAKKSDEPCCVLMKAAKPVAAKAKQLCCVLMKAAKPVASKAKQPCCVLMKASKPQPAKGCQPCCEKKSVLAPASRKTAAPCCQEEAAPQLIEVIKLKKC